ncbi:LysR family transcriptional regulator [Collinsella sp. zg1085]|uniref:LysR family transcriptional regulator n=1 Tax=Collinsella sp. zg1085 TaxID=2844380 RepID=UPI001C0BC4D7|nr:LysR family transcriptional regulator [Collinsella sp. zg1085]QWT17350.1 LysR family transcriptional regulator [Collinsella sp. zg1085]
MMNLHQLEYLQAVISCGGIRPASYNLHVSPQAVSIAIKKLEEELGTQLFIRSGNELIPTQHGVEVSQRAAIILSQCRELGQLKSELHEGISPDGHFRLYVPQLFGRGSLFEDEAYERFLEAYPDIHLDVWHQTGSSLHAVVEHGITDAALVFGRTQVNGIVFHDVRSVTMYAYWIDERVTHNSVSLNSNFISKHLFANPYCFSEVMTVFRNLPTSDLLAMRFRDISPDIDSHLAFMREGGVIFGLSNSIYKNMPEVSSGMVYLDSQKKAQLPVYFCCKQGNWGKWLQKVYWHSIENLQVLD